MDRCPTCSKPLGETVTDRILAALSAAAPDPLESRELARRAGALRTTIYTITRRMEERGAIRKATIRGVTGWVLVPHAERVSTPEELVTQEALRNLVKYIQSVEELAATSALRYLSKLLPRLEDEERQDLIESLVDQGALTREDDRLRVVGQ